MMGEQTGRQDRLFYKFCLEDVIPADHLLRRIDDVLDLSWLWAALTPYHSHVRRQNEWDCCGGARASTPPSPLPLFDPPYPNFPNSLS